MLLAQVNGPGELELELQLHHLIIFPLFLFSVFSVFL